MNPEIRLLKCPDKMSEQSQNCSDVVEFWSDTDRNYNLQNGQKLSDDFRP